MVNRRAAVRAVLISPLVALAVAAGAGVDPAGAVAPDPPPAPVTVNEFLPDDANIGDCLGALERPGCGSSARGGWRQTAVFAAMITGLAVIFGRIAWSVSKRSRPTA